jgi:hypothetical protein
MRNQKHHGRGCDTTFLVPAAALLLKISSIDVLHQDNFVIFIWPRNTALQCWFFCPEFDV